MFRELFVAIAHYINAEAGMILRWNRINTESSQLWRASYANLRELGRLPVVLERRRGAA